MANITARRDKTGAINAYQIRVFRGRNSDGTRLKDYCMTWRPTPGMTKRQIEKELERQATLFEEACKQGSVSTEKPTFEKYASYVVNLKERAGAKAKTISSYLDLLERVNREIGAIKVQDLRPDHLNRLYEKLAEPGQNMITGGGLSAKTIREHHRVISSVLAQAVKEGLIPYNIAQRATPPRVPRHEMKTFEAEEVQAIMEALETEPMKWQVCTHLLIATGARRGEIAGLKWTDVDWKNRRLHLRENRVYTARTGAVSTSLKTDESRVVSISSHVLDLLKRWKAEQAAYFSRLGITPIYILTAESGGPIHPDSPTKWLAKFSERHGLPHIHPHLFRHTQASLLIAEGVDIVTVSKRLGHSKTSTTMDIYSHLLAKSDEKASDTIDDLLYRQKQA